MKILAIPRQGHSLMVLALSRPDKMAGPATVDFIRRFSIQLSGSCVSGFSGVLLTCGNACPPRALRHDVFRSPDPL